MCMAWDLKARERWPIDWLKLWVQELQSLPLSILHDLSILCVTYAPGEPCIRKE